MTTMTGLVITVLLAAWCDLSTWRIPNRLIAASASAAIVLALFAPDGIGITACLAGGLTGLGLFLPIYMLGGTAAGDVKLMTILGMYAGPLLALDLALMIFIIGGVWSLGFLLLQRPQFQLLFLTLKHLSGSKKIQSMNTPSPIVTADGKTRAVIPYGPVIAIGTIGTLLLTSL
jgi:prepilin peptidase CpaA